MIKKLIMLVVLISALFVLSFNVSGFSLSPGSHPVRGSVYDYDENKGLNEEFFFIISSNSAEPIIIEVEITGPFEEYITFPEGDFLLEPRESKRISGSINLPPGLENVGVVNVRISFRKKSLNEGMMAFTTGYNGLIRILFKYPGEFIVLRDDFEVKNVRQGEDTSASWTVEARGEGLTSYINELKITDSEGDILFFAETEKNFLSKHETRRETLDVFSSNFSPGAYQAILTSRSNDNVAERRTELRIGQEDVALRSFNPKTFNVGDVLEFSFILESLWNDDFKNSFAVLEVEDISMTTKSFDIRGFRKISVDNQFINLRRLTEGSYEANLTVFFGDNSKTFHIDLVGVMPAEEDEADISFVWVLVPALTLLILAGLLVLLFKKTNK